MHYTFSLSYCICRFLNLKGYFESIIYEVSAITYENFLLLPITSKQKVYQSVLPYFFFMCTVRIHIPNMIHLVLFQCFMIVIRIISYCCVCCPTTKEYGSGTFFQPFVFNITLIQCRCRLKKIQYN